MNIDNHGDQPTTQRDQRSLNQIGQSLPDPEPTIYAYDPITIHGGTAYLAGQIPKQAGDLAYQGLVGQDVSLEEAKMAAEICVEQSLAWLHNGAGGLGNVAKILRMDCFIAHADGFSQISEIADAASEKFMAVFGTPGRHSRSVIGVRSLPRQAPVLLEVTAALHHDGA